MRLGAAHRLSLRALERRPIPPARLGQQLHPGRVQNAIDWLSRPSADIARVFRGKPVALSGASPGGFGTILSQNAWLPVLRTLGAEFWSEGRLLVSSAQTVFGEDGTLSDQKIRELLTTFLRGFAAFARSSHQGPSA